MLVQRASRVVGCWALVVVVVMLVVRPAGAEEDSLHRDVRERQGGDALPLSSLEVPVVSVGGVPFVWPALDAVLYADPGAASFRAALERWQKGERDTPALPPPASDAIAALFLAADIAFLQAGGADELWTVSEAYERALRIAPDFADAARAHFQLGHVRLALALAPEAGASFLTVERRFPASPLVLDAKLGRAAALRQRRRPAEARQLVDEVLAQGRGDVLCRARLEEARQERVVATPGTAAAAFTRLAEKCPALLTDAAVLADHAETLAAAGDLERARALLAAPRAGEPDPRLQLLTGALAADAGQARVEYERVRQQVGAAAPALEAEMRLILLDAADDPGKAASRLAALAARPGPVALRALVLGEAAEAKARAGRFDEALALLDRAAHLGPEGRTQADGRRGEMLGRWIATLDAAGDAIGIVIVYAAHRTDLDSRAAPEDRIAIARALGGLGLHAPAAALLARDQTHAMQPGIALALAEAALAVGEIEDARAAARRVAAAEVPKELSSRLHVVAARAALAAGDLDEAASEAAEVDDVTLRSEVAAALLPREAAQASALLQPVLGPDTTPPVRALLTAGAAASAERAWEVAAASYARALAGGAVGDEAVEAAAGLLRARLERTEAAPEAWATLGSAERDPVVRRVARAFAAEAHAP
jgi:tetratricopeptide (TPR) repeat protein